MNAVMSSYLSVGMNGVVQVNSVAVANLEERDLSASKMIA